MAEQRPWLKLDNAAKIYPAAMRRNWTSIFRFSATLTEEVDVPVLEEALRCALPRFPGFSVRLRRGVFWFYLEQKDEAPTVQEDVANPCVRMDLHTDYPYMFRVRHYGRRIALEVFHVLTDGTGGLTFLKTLVAEYLRLKYGADIPRGGDILDCGEPPRSSETEDAYIKFARTFTRSRREADAYFIGGQDEPLGVIHITTGIIPVKELLEKAHEKGVTLTEYIAAVMIMSGDTLQRREVKSVWRMKPVKICVPVNLRAFYPTETLRNFSIYVNPGIDPRMGEFSFDEILNAVHHFMGAEITEKMLNARFTTNVQVERQLALRVMPLFIKNVAMRFVFDRKGDRKTTTTLTNLGYVKLPEEMERYVERMDMVLGPLSRTRVTSAALSYGDKLYITFTRTVKESVFEREVFRNLVKLGVPVKVESNNRW